MAEDREVLKDDRVVESEAPVDPSNSKQFQLSSFGSFPLKSNPYWN